MNTTQSWASWPAHPAEAQQTWSVVGREVHSRDEGVIVARVPEWGIASDRADRSEANARLIAAAPDLLKWLTETVKTLGPEQHELRDRARAAIAKATGGAA